MLSTSAFNALLKTLEEPPPHVKFLFATTEVNKVPVTVLSRCQRFDLRRITADRLAEHFRWIVGEEGAEAEDEARASAAIASTQAIIIVSLISVAPTSNAPRKMKGKHRTLLT